MKIEYNVKSEVTLREAVEKMDYEQAIIYEYGGRLGLVIKTTNDDFVDIFGCTCSFYDKTQTHALNSDLQYIKTVHLSRLTVSIDGDE